MMSGAVAEGKEAPNLDPKVLKRVSSGPSSPRTPSPAASLLTISSATDKSKACDEASCSGRPIQLFVQQATPWFLRTG